MVGMNQIASAAYGATQKLPTSVTAADGMGRPMDGSDFAELVKSGLEEAIGSQHKAEGLSSDMVQGKADINDVILATQNADMALNTVTALRDKIINAYQDILRMAI